MTQLRPLIILAVIGNLLTVVLYIYAASQPGGTGDSLAFIVLWMPAVWITTIVLTIILTIKQRQKLFTSDKIKWTVITLMFCTPIPLWFGYLLAHPESKTSLSSSSYNSRNGKIYKTESWYYTSNYRQKYIDMYFIADSLDEAKNGENAFKKDSIWTYFSDIGDTLKIEKYKAGKLILAIKQIKK